MTHWTIRIAIAAYLASVTLRLTAPHSPRAMSLARLTWTLAGAGCLAHIACAFHFHHGWSHAEAYRHIARTTYEVIGWDWGGGLYVNYAFALLWLADVAWWWTSPHKYLLRPAAANLAMHFFVFFIIFNATVVFGSGWTRFAGVAGTLFLGALLMRRWLRAKSPTTCSL